MLARLSSAAAVAPVELERKLRKRLAEDVHCRKDGRTLQRVGFGHYHSAAGKHRVPQTADGLVCGKCAPLSTEDAIHEPHSVVLLVGPPRTSRATARRG